jgi:hypothetical protein
MPAETKVTIASIFSRMSISLMLATELEAKRREVRQTVI